MAVFSIYHLYNHKGLLWLLVNKHLLLRLSWYSNAKIILLSLWPLKPFLLFTDILMLRFNCWTTKLFMQESIKIFFCISKLQRRRKIGSIVSLIHMKKLSFIAIFSGHTKVIYTKYSKQWPYTVAHTINCVCRKC